MALLNVKAVSEWLQVKPSTIYLWAEQDGIPHLKLGRLLRFDPDEIEAWLLSRRRAFNPQPRPQRRRRCGADHVDDLIAQAKGEIYTPSRGKPDQTGPQERGRRMALYKRNLVWWMRFRYQGRQIRRSTETTNKKQAERTMAGCWASSRKANGLIDPGPRQAVTACSTGTSQCIRRPIKRRRHIGGIRAWRRI